MRSLSNACEKGANIFLHKYAFAPKSRVPVSRLNGRFSPAAGTDLYVRPIGQAAAESRFARRIIAHELHDILAEPDQSTEWVSTIASPTEPTLRYVWLIHPDPSPSLPVALADEAIRSMLMKYVLSISGQFEQSLVMGIALPNGRGKDNSIAIVVHDRSNWTASDHEESRKLREGGIFDAPEANHRMHFR